MKRSTYRPEEHCCLRFHKRLINLFMLCLRRGVRGVIYCMSVDQEVYKTNALRATQYVTICQRLRELCTPAHMPEMKGSLYVFVIARDDAPSFD